MDIRGYTRICSTVCAFLFLACANSSSYADTLYLKNGRSIDGIVITQEGDTVELEVCAGVVKFKRSEVARIVKSSSQESGALKQEWEKQTDDLHSKIARQNIEELRRPKEIEVISKGRGIMVKARINHKVDALLVLDTGASFVMLRKKVADDLGIKLNNVKPDTKMKLADGREVNGAHVVLDSIRVQASEARNVEAAVLLDESGTMDFGDGLLGMSFLNHFKFTVDQKNKKLVLEKLE